MCAASQLSVRSPLVWMLPLYLHVNQKSGYDDMMYSSVQLFVFSRPPALTTTHTHTHTYLHHPLPPPNMLVGIYTGFKLLIHPSVHPCVQPKSGTLGDSVLSKNVQTNIQMIHWEAWSSSGQSIVIQFGKIKVSF